MYEEMTPERIKGELLKEITTLDTREGSFTDDMAGPVAVQLYKVYQSLNAVQPIVWVNEGSGRYLDMAAEDLGIEPRKAGTKAAVTLELTGTAGFSVKAGTRFLTADNLAFVTVEDAVIPEAGMAAVPAEAEKAGAAYNVGPGEIAFQYENDNRIQKAGNPEAAQGGTDPESDASLYARIVYARQKPSTSGNKYDYERWAREVPGVGEAKCTPIWDGPGTVRVLVVDEDRQPVDVAIVEACAAHIEEVRPIGAAVTVVSASALPISAAAKVTVDGSTTLAAVQRAFSAALGKYLRSLAFEKYEVLYNRVGALLISIDGVVDYTGLTLNGKAESVAVGPEEIPALGEVTLT